MAQTLKLAKGDLFVNAAGHYQTIEGIDKAAQDVASALLQDFDPEQDFGSELAQLQTPRFTGLGSLQGIIGQKVQQAIDRLIRLQLADQDKIGPEEFIDRIGNLRVTQLADALSFQFLLEVVVESDDAVLQAVEVDLTHQIPDSAVPGTPGVQLS